MQFVLDLNYSRSEELEQFLKDGNSIILTDDFLLEPFRSSEVSRILISNIQILRKYSEQYNISYSIRELIDKETNSKHPLIQNQLINSDATVKIRKILAQPNHIIQERVTKLQSRATKRLKLAAEFTETFIRDMANYTQKKMKKEQPLFRYSNNYDKLLADISYAAHQMTSNNMQKRGGINNYPSIFHSQISISFAFSFSYIWRIINWAIKDGYQNATDSIKGDVFDIGYLAISSLSDGILTKDKWMNKCRDELISIFKITN
ncbi:hypothetical protein [Leptospira levettii]|uniref:hypothetical protein n=1 Tax=Leptospira levettii TaxID=2023178 RepID=UPI000C2B2144|nr:hypothetical protein [Leptospira levettii]PJZ87452.1 hypothetical protein CH368_16735 [Leptospira levettii]